MESSSYSATTRRPCFIEEDAGLASIADMEAGFSGNCGNNGNNGINNNNNNAFFSRPLCNTRRSSLRNLASISSPRSAARFYDARFEDHQPHFLESCFLCKKQLADNKDIYMYRGDTPFCTVECRQEQIEMDEAQEKNWNLSSSMKALRKKKDLKKSSSPNKAEGYPFRSSTVAAA